MVRTDQMWRYADTARLMHYHPDENGRHTVEVWTTLKEVRPSPEQGWNFELYDGCVLQSCFADTEIEVAPILGHVEAAIRNWHK